MNNFPKDDEHSIHNDCRGEANLNYYYAHQLCQGEEHVFDIGAVEITQINLKHIPVLENSLTGKIYAQGNKFFGEFTTQNGVFEFKCPPGYAPFIANECSVDWEKGEVYLKWKQRSPRDVKVEVDYEYDAECTPPSEDGCVMTRNEVFELINGERAYQDTLRGNLIPSIEQELLLLEEYCLRARKTYSDTFGDPTEEPTRDFIRKIAGIAVRCMEHHGAPPRGKFPPPQR